MQIDGLVGLIMVGLWVFAMFDVISADSASVRNLPKPLWVLLVVLLPDVGAIAWLLLGRPAKTSRRVADEPIRRPRSRSRVSAEEEGDFIARIEARDRMLAQWAEEDRRKAEESSGVRPPLGDQAEIDRRVAELEADLARGESELQRGDDGANPAG